MLYISSSERICALITHLPCLWLNFFFSPRLTTEKPPCNVHSSDTGNTVYAFVCAIPGNDYAEVRILNHLWNMYSNKNNVLHHLFSSPIPRLSLVGVAQHQALCDVCSSIFVNNAALSFTSVYFFPGSWGMKFML